jgi:four helix bundle protein
MSMHNFKELKIWQKSRVLTKDVYLLTKYFPKKEDFELSSQLRRSAISIVSNIAEGSGRESNREFRRVLNISISSGFELETQIILAYDLGYINEDGYGKISEQIIEVQKMIFGFRKSLSSLDKTLKIFISI